MRNIRATGQTCLEENFHTFNQQCTVKPRVELSLIRSIMDAPLAKIALEIAEEVTERLRNGEPLDNGRCEKLVHSADAMLQQVF